MAILKAQDLEQIRQNVAEWYAETRQYLLARLEEGGFPYGSAAKPEEVQLMEFLNMTPQSWAAMYQSFLERYRGLPDAQQRAATDMETYRWKMEQLRDKVNSTPQGVVYG